MRAARRPPPPFQLALSTSFVFLSLLHRVRLAADVIVCDATRVLSTPSLHPFSLLLEVIAKA